MSRILVISSCFSALIATWALLALFLLLERSFEPISRRPASSSTVRTELPARIPLPGAGIILTQEAAYLASISCGIDISLVVLTVIIFFLASRKAFSIASGVSEALPWPTPTIPFLLPATRQTEKLKRLPPAITRVTRLRLTIFWSNSGLMRASRRDGRRPCLLPPPPASLREALRAGLFSRTLEAG